MEREQSEKTGDSCAEAVPELELARLTRWRNENIELIGTPIFEQTTILHRQLTDLIARRL